MKKVLSKPMILVLVTIILLSFGSLSFPVQAVENQSKSAALATDDCDLDGVPDAEDNCPRLFNAPEGSGMQPLLCGREGQ